VDVKARILTTNIDLDEGSCDLDLVLSVADLFDLSAAEARQIIKKVAAATRTWRDAAAAARARPAEIRRMKSAFEHGDLQKALAL
jgi:serine/threonine-protein kinase HipA